MDDNDILRRVGRALERLKDHDDHLLKTDANERSITHWLAVYLQDEFPGWNVDVEYNRNIGAVKENNGSLVYPDIIVHHHNTNYNLIAIEFKKTCNDDNSDKDRNKVIGYTLKDQNLNGLKYDFGLFICGSDRPGVFCVEWYENGELIKREIVY